jgi:hypothetical protein
MWIKRFQGLSDLVRVTVDCIIDSYNSKGYHHVANMRQRGFVPLLRTIVLNVKVLELKTTHGILRYVIPSKRRSCRGGMGGTMTV